MRFYGGDPMTWLSKTPHVVVHAHVQMLARLSAEESIRDVNVQLVANNSGIDSDDRRALLADWEAEANEGRRPRAARLSPDDLAGMGIGVKVKKGRA